MRLLPVLLALPFLALHAHAQTAPPQPVAPAAAATAPASTATESAKPTHHRMTWQQHFAQANLAHDGHLTMQEAHDGYPSLARHFTEIDADKKGFVTEGDVANWHKLQRAMHHANHSQPEQGLRPSHAMQQGTIRPQRVNTTSGQLLPMTQSDATTTR